MAVEISGRSKIMAGVLLLVVAGAGSWFFFFQDEPLPPPPAPKPQPVAAATKPPAAAAKPASVEKPAAPASGDAQAQREKKLRPSSGKYYSDQQLQGLLVVCVFATLAQEERFKPITAQCEKIVELHEAGNEAVAIEVMKKAGELMVAAGMLSTEPEKDDPWQSGIPPKAVALNKEGKDLHYKAGGGKATFDAAIEKFRQALAIKPDYYTGTRNLAEALSFKRDPRGVEDNYRKAVAIAEKHGIRDMELYEKYGNHLQVKGRLPEAKKIYQKGLKLDPNNSRLLDMLGAVHEQEKDFKAAMSAYQRAAQGGSTFGRERLEELQKRKPEPDQSSPKEEPAPAKPRAQAPAPVAAKSEAVARAEQHAAPDRAAERPAMRELYTRYNDLVSAVVMRDRVAVAELLAGGKYANVRQSDGRTALMIAAANGDADIAEMLLAKGADPNLRARGGATALSEAGNNAEVVRLLERYGAKQ